MELLVDEPVAHLGRLQLDRLGTGRRGAFGPVAAVIAVDGEDEAVRVANDTRFGLGASVWTANPARGVAVARRIRSGAVFVNAVVASDVRMPFGGTRASGYGRELAAAGIREFVNVRTWWVLDEPAGTSPAAE